MKIFYFGCNTEPGHYMWAPGLGYNREARDFTYGSPWGHKIDDGLCPKGPEIEGHALIHNKNGWTAISFWDRSVDKRGKCNSNFLAEGAFTFDEMITHAKKYFPEIMARFSYPIIEVKEK